MLKYFANILFLVTCLAAQERLTPPPQVMQPSDTLAVDREMQKITPSSDQIELPEVVIIGEDRSRRVADNKLGLEQSGPRLIMPTYQSFSAWERRQQEQPVSFRSAVSRKQWFRLRTEGGSFATLRSDVNYGRNLNKGVLQTSAFLHRSDGAYKNSQYLEGGLDAKINYAVRPNLQAAFQADYEGSRCGLYGAVWPKAERRINMTKVHTGVTYRLGGISSFDWQMTYEGLWMQSDSSHRRLQKSGSNLIGMSGRYATTWHKVPFSTQIEYLHESISPYASADADVSFGQASADFWLPLTYGLQMNAIIGFQSISMDSLHKTRFSPAIGWRYLTHPAWSLSLKMGSGMRYVGYRSTVEINPFMAHAFPGTPQEEKFYFALLTEFRPKQTWSAQVVVSKSWLNHYLYWQRQKETGLITLHSVRDPELLEMQIRFDYRWNDRGHVAADVTTLSDKVLIADSSGGNGHLPYRPAVKMALTVDYEILKKLYFTLESEFCGDRYASLQGNEKLASYGLINLTISKHLDPYAVIYLSFRNLLDSSFHQWQGYPEMGFHMIAGARLRL